MGEMIRNTLKEPLKLKNLKTAVALTQIECFATVEPNMCFSARTSTKQKKQVLSWIPQVVDQIAIK